MCTLTLNNAAAAGAQRRGWISVFIPPPKKKSAQVNFLWGKMTSERLFNSFIHPQKLLYPPKQISGYAPEQLLFTRQ